MSVLPPKILASCQLTDFPALSEGTRCRWQGRLAHWRAQQGAWRGSGTHVPSVAELLKTAWRRLVLPGEDRGRGELVHLMPHLPGPGSLSMVLPSPSWSRAQGKGRAGIVCLSCLSVQGFRMLSNPSGWKMSSNYKFLLLFLLPCKSSDAGFHMPICFCLRRFIQIESEEKSRLPNHNDLSKNPLNHSGNPNKSTAWRWVACIALAKKTHGLLFHLTLL